MFGVVLRNKLTLISDHDQFLDSQVQVAVQVGGRAAIIPQQSDGRSEDLLYSALTHSLTVD